MSILRAVLLPWLLAAAPPAWSRADCGPVEADSLREELARTYATIARAAPGRDAELLDSATALARAIACATGDSFPAALVDRFRRWSPRRRQGKSLADSLRRAGNVALSADGPEAAITLWQRSVAEALAAGDSAGVATGLGNIAAGFHVAGRLDSVEHYLRRAQALAERLGDYRTAGNAMSTRAALAKDRGEPLRAHRLYQDALAARSRVGDARGRAADLNNLGLLAESAGDEMAAEQYYHRALGLNQASRREGAMAANLVNLANLAVKHGAYDSAHGLYNRAAELRQARGERLEEATVLQDLGLLAFRRGMYDEAGRSLRKAVQLDRELGAADAEASGLIALSRLYAAMGDPQSAIDAVHQAEELARRVELYAETRQDLTLAAAELALALNDLGLAEQRFGEAAAGSARDDSPGAEAAALEGLATVLLRRERPAEAQAPLARALALERAAGDERAVAGTALLQGYAEETGGAPGEARRLYHDALGRYRRLSDAAGSTVALIALARLEYERGNLAAAAALHRQAWDEGRRRHGPWPSWLLRSEMALVREREGRPVEAIALLRESVAELERLGGRVRVPERRSGFLADKWEPYARLARLERGAGHPVASLEVSEQLRARQLLDQLSRGRVERPASAGSLAGREQDLRRRMSQLSARQPAGLALGEVASGESERDLDPSGSAAALARAEAEYGRLLVQLKDTDPVYTELVRAEPVAAAELQRLLAPDELLLEYLVLDSVTVAYAVRPERIATFELPVGRSRLAGAVEFVRDVVADAGAPTGQEAWVAPLRRLRRELLDDVERAGMLVGVRRLIIVPHAELHYLPFAALLGGKPRESFLVERFEVTYAPSASAWARLERRAVSGGGSILAGAPTAGALPGAAREVLGLGGLPTPSLAVLTGAEATETRMRALGAAYDIVHLATYGVLNKGNPLFSYVQLQPDARHDGRLAVHEVFGLDWHPSLVVLSACETAVGAGAVSEVPEGDDWVGLVQAFLAGGAARVLATLWRIDDRGAATFMTEFHRQRIATGSVSTALAQAQRTLLHAPGTRAPVYWAGFTLSGAR